MFGWENQFLAILVDGAQIVDLFFLLADPVSSWSLQLQMVDGPKQYDRSFTQKQHFNLNSEARRPSCLSNSLINSLSNL